MIHDTNVNGYTERTDHLTLICKGVFYVFYIWFGLRNQISVPVFVRGNKILVRVRMRTIWLHAPERVTICYYAIKHG